MRVIGVGEGGGDVGLEEGDEAIDLLEGDLGEDARRVFEVLACLGEDLGDVALAGDDVAEAGVGGGERALHQNEDGAGDAGGVVVGVLFPVADGLERELLRADGVEQDLAVRGDWGIEGGGIDGAELAFVGVQRGDLALNVCGGVVLKLGVVLVKAGGGAGGGIEAEEDVSEILLGERGEGLRRSIGGGVLGEGRRKGGRLRGGRRRVCFGSRGLGLRMGHLRAVCGGSHMQDR